MHKFTGVQVLRGVSVEFTFEDGSRVVKELVGHTRSALVNGSMRKGGKKFVLRDGTEYKAEDMYVSDNVC